jgi:hypothetical protein
MRKRAATGKERVVGLRGCEKEGPYDNDYEDNQHDSQPQSTAIVPRSSAGWSARALIFWLIPLAWKLARR